MKYIDLDVVETKRGVRVITDLNNIGMERSKQKDDYYVSESLELPQNARITLTRRLKQHVGNIVRITVTGKKMTIMKLREIDSTFAQNQTKIFGDYNAQTCNYNKYLKEYKVNINPRFKKGML